jgi:hypothetical protein
MKHQAYFTRALKARDPRFARIFDKLGYRTTDMVAADQVEPEPAQTETDVPALRAAYEQALGKKPFPGWDAATLLSKIAEARPHA